MGKLKNALKDVFGEDCFLDGSSIREKKRVFSIIKKDDDQVVGLKIDGCVVADSSERCDGLFFVWRPSSSNFAIVLVELKGSNTSKAASQIVATSKYLIKITNCNRNDHVKFMKENYNFPFPSPPSHGSCLLGIAVSKKGLPQSSDIKRRLKLLNKIKFVHLKPSNSTSMTVEQIISACQREK